MQILSIDPEKPGAYGARDAIVWYLRQEALLAADAAERATKAADKLTATVRGLALTSAAAALSDCRFCRPGPERIGERDVAPDYLG